MNITSMTATFGTLRGATMKLKDGLNLRSLPNEAGKSTWLAFLSAMFYGIPTNERASKAGIPAKVRYQPWSGDPMEGVIELVWQDRPLRIARSTGLQGPMAEFQATWQDSGEAVSGMTGENCGQMLFGVTRSVFERSALIRQNQLTVTQTPELEEALGALVSSGDASASYTRVSRTLKDWQNQRQYHKSGRLPEALAQRAALQAQLEALDASTRSSDADASELAALTQQRQALASRAKELAVTGSAGMAQPVTQAQEEAARTERVAAALREQALPPLNEIDMLLHNLKSIEQDAQALAAQPKTADGVTSGVQLAVFRDLSREEAAEKAEEDVERYRSLHRAAVRDRLLPLISIFAFLLAIVSVFILPVTFCYLVAALLVLAGAAFLVLSHICNKSGPQAQADALLAAYGAEDEDGILQAARSYLAAQTRSTDASYSAAKAELARRVTAIRKAVSPLGRADSIRGCRDTLQAARLRRLKLDRAEEEAREAKAVYERLIDAAGTPEDIAADQDATEGLDAELAGLDARINQLRSSVSMEQGRAAALGSTAELQQQIDGLDEEIETLRAEVSALEMAQDALASAAAEMQGRVFPQLTEPASRYLSQLTNGKYEQVIADRNLNLSARPAGGTVDRRVMQLSSGTADQLYLALRLALCDTALPADAPVFLDDALLNFDDERLGLAMQLLRQQAENRQILLLSCTGRELRWNQSHPVSV